MDEGQTNFLCIAGRRPRRHMHSSATTYLNTVMLRVKRPTRKNAAWEEPSHLAGVVLKEVMCSKAERLLMQACANNPICINVIHIA